MASVLAQTLDSTEQLLSDLDVCILLCWTQDTEFTLFPIRERRGQIAYLNRVILRK